MASKPAKKLKKPIAKKVSHQKSTPDLKIPKPKVPYSRNQLLTALAEHSQNSKVAVKQMLEALEAIIKVHLAKNGPGVFKFLGLIKMLVKIKPASKARKGISPLTGQEMTFKAKPASRVVRIRALKKLKEAL